MCIQGVYSCPSYSPTGTLTKAEILKMGSLITGAELNSMQVIWADYLNASDPDGQTRLELRNEDPTLLAQILQSTMGVEKQIGMSSEALYQQMGAITKGNFLGLPNMNYATPTDGWHSYEAAGNEDLVMFNAQLTSNNERQSDGPILNSGFKALALRWHQLCGVHRFLSHVSSPSRPSLPPLPDQVHHRQGLLISDEVGIGKTAQALGGISQIIYWASLATENSPFPEVHGK